MKDLSITLEKEIKKTIDNIYSCNWSNKDFYSDYVAQTFYYVRHSTRLLALCASRLNYETEQPIHLRFIKHLGEEFNHEKLATNDLKNLGVHVNDFPELITTRLLYEPQYYKIEHERPLALMGYVLYLEALAQKLSPIVAKEISNKYGPKTATFFQVHGEEDPKHVAEAVKLISSLSEADLISIENNLIQSSEIYNMLIHDLQAKWFKSSLKKSA